MYLKQQPHPLCCRHNFCNFTTRVLRVKVNQLRVENTHVKMGTTFFEAGLRETAIKTCHITQEGNGNKVLFRNAKRLFQHIIIFTSSLMLIVSIWQFDINM